MSICNLFLSLECVIRLKKFISTHKTCNVFFHFCGKYLNLIVITKYMLTFIQLSGIVFPFHVSLDSTFLTKIQFLLDIFGVLQH